MNFRSDNEAPAAPEIMDALARANRGSAHSYGADAITQRLQTRFSDLFETEVAVYPVSTGTAANALSPNLTGSAATRTCACTPACICWGACCVSA